VKIHVIPVPKQTLRADPKERRSCSWSFFNWFSFSWISWCNNLDLNVQVIKSFGRGIFESNNEAETNSQTKLVRFI